MSRTYFVAFFTSVQLQMLFNIPSAFNFSDLDFPLPSSEEEWAAPTEADFFLLRSPETSPETPLFNDSVQLLFQKHIELRTRYSELGGHILIAAITLAIMDAYRLARHIPTMTPDFTMFDVALENWRKLWQIDPKSGTAGPNGPFGAITFNSAGLYRAACIRKVRDYARYYQILFSVDS
jgi:Fungal specific transcription factor domain